MIEFTERDYRARVAAGARPTRMWHDAKRPCYDYTRIVVTWHGETTPVTYAFAPRHEHDALDGYPDRCALDRAQAILSDHARGLEYLLIRRRIILPPAPPQSYDHPLRTRPGGYRDHGLVDHRTR